MAVALPGCGSGTLGRADSAQPHCPRCGYVLAHIPEDRCPECGLGYSLLAVERIEHFLGTVLVRQYQAALGWSIAGLFVAALPLALPRADSEAFLWLAAAGLVTPTLFGIVQSLRAFSKEWAVPVWTWVSPLMGV